MDRWRTYEEAVEAAGVTELPAVARATAPDPQVPCRAYRQVLADLDARRPPDNNPHGTPR